MPGSALVLSGGGPLGVGWELGRPARTAGQRRGPGPVRTRDRHLSGAIAGALLTSGAGLEPVRVQPKADLLTSPRPAATNPEAARQVFAVLAQGGSEDPARRAQLGAIALDTTLSEDVYLDIRRHVVPDVPWPRALVVTAVDVADGAFASWGIEDGVSLLRAAAASTALPGAWPPVTIGGRRFMDGGMRSPISADLASGSRLVVVVAAVPQTDQAASRFAAETAIEAAGGEIVEIRPDADQAPSRAPASRVKPGPNRSRVELCGLSQRPAESCAISA